MVSIKVLGSGCPNCKRLEQSAIRAAELVREEHNGFSFNVEKITNPEQFLDYGLMATPGLVIEEKLVSSGRIPSGDEITAWLSGAIAAT